MRAASPTVAVRRVLVALALGTSSFASLAACSAILGLTEPAVDGGAAGDADARREPEGASTTDATSSPDGTCSADLARDRSNCGVCGRSCLGGDCIAGRCEPARVATAFTLPLDLASDGAFLYLGTSAGLVRLPRSDLAKWKLIAPAVTTEAPDRLARKGSDLYVRRRSNVIERCTLPECSDGVRVAAGLGLVENLVVADGFGGAQPIVWLDSLREVVGVPLADAGARVIATTNTRKGALHVFGDAGTLYWSEDSARRISRAAPGASAIEIFDLAPHKPVDFAFLGDAIYFVTEDQELMRGRLRDGALVEAETLFVETGTRFLGAVVSDGTSLYVRWGASIRRCDRDRGCPDDAVLFQLPSTTSIRSILVEEDRIYFAVGEGATNQGSLYVVAK